MMGRFFRIELISRDTPATMLLAAQVVLAHNVVGGYGNENGVFL